MTSRIVGVAILILLLGAGAWAPWISDSTAKNRTLAAFAGAQSGIMDGCGVTCEGCGATATRKVPFGRLVTLQYACGLLPADLPQYHRRKAVFVSAFGTVHGLP